MICKHLLGLNSLLNLRKKIINININFSSQILFLFFFKYCYVFLPMKWLSAKQFLEKLISCLCWISRSLDLLWLKSRARDVKLIETDQFRTSSSPMKLFSKIWYFHLDRPIGQADVCVCLSVCMFACVQVFPHPEEATRYLLNTLDLKVPFENLGPFNGTFLIHWTLGYLKYTLDLEVPYGYLPHLRTSWIPFG